MGFRLARRANSGHYSNSGNMSAAMVWIYLLVIVPAALWVIPYFLLRGTDLSRYDLPVERQEEIGQEPSDQHFELLAWLNRLSAGKHGCPG